MANDIFISYSRKDIEYTRLLFSELDKRERNSWVDWEGIPLSADWWQEIKSGIETADTFIFVTSNNSLQSPVCNLEVAHAISHNKRIIPIILQDDSPEKLDEKSAFASIAAVDIDEAMQERLGNRDLLLIARDNWKILSKLNWIFLKFGTDFTEQFENLLKAIDTDLAHVKRHTEILQAALQWEKLNRSQSVVLRGSQLEDAELWLTKSHSKEPRATELQTAFIVASRETVNKEKDQELQLQRRATNRTRYLFASVTLFSIIVAFLLVFAWLNIQAAERASDTSQSISIAANALLQSDVRQSETTALLAIRSLNAQYSAQAETLLYRSLNNLSTIQIFDSHEQRVRAVDFTIDGNAIITGSYDEYLRLFDLASGSLIWETQFSQAVMALDQTSDGESIVIGTWDAKVYVINRRTGQISKDLTSISYEELPTRGMVLDIEVSPDNSKVLVVMGNRVLEWSLSEDTILRSLVDSESSGYLTTAVYLPNNRIATAGGDTVIRIWSEDLQLEQELFGHGRDIMALRLSHDQRTLASASVDNTVRLWDVQSGLEILQYEGHTEMLRTLAFSPDDRFIVSVGMDNIGHVWNASTGEVERYLVGHGEAIDYNSLDELNELPQEGIYAVAYSPDGRFIVTGGFDGEARIWSVQERSFKTHLGAVTAIAFSPDSRYLLSGGVDSTIRLWNITTSEEMRRFNGSIYAVYDLGFSSDGNYVYSAGRDGASRIWHINNSTPQRQFPETNWDANTSPTLYSSALNSDASLLFTGNETGTVSIYQTLDNSLLREFTTSSDIYEIAVSPDEAYIAVASWGDALIKIILTETGEELRWFISEPISKVWTVEFSPDGNYLAAGFEDGTIRIFDIAEYKEVANLNGHIAAVTSLSYSPNGEYLLSGSFDSTARLWNIRDQTEIRQIVAHSDGVLDVAYSPDGLWFATASLDGSFRLWNADYHALIDYACTRLFEDLDANERRLYNVDETPTCPRFAAENPQEPLLWTPYPQNNTVENVAIPTVLPTAAPDAYLGDWVNSRSIGTIRFSPDDQYLYVHGGYGTGEITVLDANTLAPIQTIEIGNILDFSISEDGLWVITIDETDDSGNVPIVYNARSGQRASRDIVEQFGGERDTRIYASDGRSLRTRWMSNGTALYLGENIDTGEILASPLSQTGAFDISDDGDLIAFGIVQNSLLTTNNYLIFHNIRGNLPNSILFPSLIQSVQFFQDSERILIAGENGTVQIWNYASQTLLYDISRAMGETVNYYTRQHRLYLVNDDELLVYIPYGDLNAYIYDTNTGTVLDTIALSAGVNVVELSNDGTKLALGDRGGRVVLWNISRFASRR